MEIGAVAAPFSRDVGVCAACCPPPAARHPSPLGAQEFKLLEDAAFKVLERVETTKAALAAKGEELAAIRSEYEQKKKEVRCRAVPCYAWGGGAVCWGVYVVSTDE